MSFTDTDTRRRETPERRHSGTDTDVIRRLIKERILTQNP